jgi:hypothetical protein
VTSEQIYCKGVTNVDFARLRPDVGASRRQGIRIAEYGAATVNLKDLSLILLSKAESEIQVPHSLPTGGQAHAAIRDETNHPEL